MTSPSDEAVRNLLEGFYSRQKGLIAFLDESYRIVEQQPALSFYIISAALIRVSEMQSARGRLIYTAGEPYWHTTELAREKEFSKITSMLKAANDVSEIFVIAVNIDFDNSEIEVARKEALVQLASQLLLNDVNLAILETRNTRKRQNADAATLSKATAAGFIGGIRLVQASPRVEPLLWIPDLVSWALRQHVMGTKWDWFESLGSKASIISWSRPDSENKKRLASASAVTSPELSGAPEGEKTIRSSDTSITNQTIQSQVFEGLVENLVSPVIDPAELKYWIKKTFPR